MTAKSAEQKSPVTELPRLTYRGFVRAASDERTPSLATQQQVFSDPYIAGKNLMPDDVCEAVKRGEMVSLHPSMWDEVPLIFLLFMSVCAIIYVSIAFPEASIGVPVQAFGPLVISATIFHRRWNSKYFIQKEGVTIVKGILNPFLFSRLQCEYTKVKTVEVSKNILQRLLNVGDIRISTALVDQPEIVLTGIVNPYFYVSVIGLLLKEHQTHAEDAAKTAREATKKTGF